MMSFNQIMRWSWAFLVAVTLSLGLAGCEGDDGAPGAAGQDGTDGTDGDDGLACWDLDGDGEQDPEEDVNGDNDFDAADCAGAAGAAAKVTPVESCAVCHGQDAVLDAAAAHKLPPIEFVDNIVIAAVAGTNDLAVTFDLERDKTPTAGYDTIERAYRTDGVTNTVFLENVSALTDNGDGSYSFTITDGNLVAGNNRYLFRVAAGTDRETRVYFYADYPASPFAGPVAVSAEACGACHGPEGIGVHGGYFQAEDGGEPCLTCHGVFAFGRDIPRLGIAAHLYHSSLWEEEVPRDSGNFEIVHVTYPTYMNNCSVCHAEDAQLAAVNAMPIYAEGCFSCHGSIAGIPFGEDWGGAHQNFNETTDCQGCHQAGGIAATVLAVTDVHNGAITERDGIIWNGVDVSVTEGAKINWEITAVDDDGTDLTITWQATYDNGAGPVAVDPCNAVAGVDAPVFFADDANGDNLSIIRNYAQGEDFILGPRANQTGQPSSTGGANSVSAANTTCDGLVATTVVSVEATDAMYGRVAIQGKPRLLSVDSDPKLEYIDEGQRDYARFQFVDEFGPLMPVRAKSPTFDWVVGEGGAAPERRIIVDTTGKCLNCHVGSMYQHGGNRVDNVDLCMLCHNSAANDQYVRANYGVDASEAYDGRVGQAFGMKEMLHAVHSAGATGAPIVIYRGRGIYAWADNVGQLNNWPDGDWPGDIEDLPIFGADGALQTHHFHTPTYPRSLNECTACHAEDDLLTENVNEGWVSLLPDPTKAMATTVEAGDPPFEDRLNDVLEGVTASSCMTCHRSGETAVEKALKAHAYQNGWEPQEFDEGRKTIIEANQ